MHLIENKGVKSECMKFGENSRQMPSVSTTCDEYCRLHLRRSPGELIHIKNLDSCWGLKFAIFRGSSPRNTSETTHGDITVYKTRCR